MQKWAFSNP